MLIRKVKFEDAQALIDLMKALDEETKFMMLEPGERQTTLEQQEQQIVVFSNSESKVMYVAEDIRGLVGFVVGVGQTARRNQHSMYCVIGVKQCAAGQGLGTLLMTKLEEWAKVHSFTRLELTVMAHNERAKRLYLSRGFEIEGIKRNSLRVDGTYVDELYMSKICLDT